MEKQHYCKISVCSLGLAIAIVWAAVVILMGILASINFGSYAGHFIDSMQEMYIGYGVSWSGIFIGAIWAFLDGFIGGAAVAWFYNLFASGGKTD